jgi:hypothetical protein
MSKVKFKTSANINVDVLLQVEVPLAKQVVPRRAKQVVPRGKVRVKIRRQKNLRKAAEWLRF